MAITTSWQRVPDFYFATDYGLSETGDPADNMAAIQAASDAASANFGTAIISKGSYDVSGELKTSSNLHLVCDGAVLNVVGKSETGSTITNSYGATDVRSIQSNICIEGLNMDYGDYPPSPIGIAQGGTINTIILAADDPATEATIVGCQLSLLDGTGLPNIGFPTVTAYNEGTKTATISGTFTAPPDTTTIYQWGWNDNPIGLACGASDVSILDTRITNLPGDMIRNGGAKGINLEQGVERALIDGLFVEGKMYRSVATSTSATISGTTLTVGGTATGQFAVGVIVVGSGITDGTTITALGTGTGGTGTYTVDTSQTVGPVSIVGEINPGCFGALAAVFIQGKAGTWTNRAKKNAVQIHVKNVVARFCGAAVAIGGADTSEALAGDPDQELVIVDGVVAHNCGHLPVRIPSVSTDHQKSGAITLFRASNAIIQNVSIYNDSDYPQTYPGYPSDFPQRYGFQSEQKTAQAGAASTITLAADDIATLDTIDGFYITLVAGTGADVTRHYLVTDYDFGTKVLTISGTFDVTPDNTTQYRWGLYGPIGAVVWGWGRNITLDNIQYHGDADTIVQINRARDIGEDGSTTGPGQPENVFDFKATNIRAVGAYTNVLTVDPLAQARVSNANMRLNLSVDLANATTVTALVDANQSAYTNTILDINDHATNTRITGTQSQIYGAGNTVASYTAAYQTAYNLNVLNGLGATWTGNESVAGWSRVGSNSTPANTTAGDLTATRLSLGNGAFGNASGLLLRISGSPSGAAIAYATFSDPVFQSDASTLGVVHNGEFRTAASVTMTNAAIFRAGQGAIGASSAITTFSGFWAASTIAPASTLTNARGFRGSVTAATNASNLYMDGTAVNQLLGNTSIGSLTAPTHALDVTGATLTTTYMRVGSLTTPSNTTAGDLTFVRGFTTDLTATGAINAATIGRGAPVTKTGDFSVATTESWLINNKAGSACVVTLPAAASFAGREIMIKNYQAQTVDSASSNVVPLGGGAAGTAILSANAGRWCTLVSDGTNWVIMSGVI